MEINCEIKMTAERRLFMAVKLTKQVRIKFSSVDISNNATYLRYADTEGSMHGRN